MRIRAQKFLIFSVVAALAIANIFAPRPVDATPHQHARVMMLASYVETGSHGDAMAKPDCHHDGRTNGIAGAPDHNCCVASCTAGAFIAAAFGFDQPAPAANYVVSTARALTPAAPFIFEPPPR